MSNITDLQEYRLRLSKIRREQDIPNTDEDFVRFLMNTLDDLVSALSFYADGRHLYEGDYDEVKLECEGSSSTDHVMGKTARDALRVLGIR